MEKPRIGVFVCRCGEQIGGSVDVAALTAYAQALPNVVFAADRVKLCGDQDMADLAQQIGEKRLNRVVVAACTPRTHETFFRDVCHQAGLDRHLLDFVNLRDQCALVHLHEPARATQKAKDLLRMGVARAAFLQALGESRQEMTPVALVIGAGIAGLTAALNLANRGFQVKLLERQAAMGGQVAGLHCLYPTGEAAKAFVHSRVEAVKNHPNIETFVEATVRSVEGTLGNYQAVVHQGDTETALTVGAIVVATGAEEFKPLGLFGYDGESVITQGEMEGLLGAGWPDEGSSVRSVVMIQCAGARDEERPYCSRICCMTAVKNALAIIERRPSAQVYVLYRDMLTLGTIYEDLYRQARGRGIVFIQYAPELPPRVESGRVTVYDELLGETLSIPCDTVVLSTPLVARAETARMARMLNVPTHPTGFFREAHAKHRPLDFETRGIFMCGSAHYPADVGESVSHAYAAAGRASILLARPEVGLGQAVATVDVPRCSACRTCELICPSGAVKVIVVDQRRGTRAAKVNEALCKGCGSCASSCRCRAIDLREFSNEQILATINAF